MPRPTKDGLYRDKSSPYWYCRWHDSNGDLHRRSTNQADSNAAMQVYNSLRIASNGKPDTATPLTVDTVLNIYHHERGHRLKGQKGYESSKVSILNFWSGVKWAELSRKGSDKPPEEPQRRQLQRAWISAGCDEVGACQGQGSPQKLAPPRAPSHLHAHIGKADEHLQALENCCRAGVRPFDGHEVGNL